MEQWEEALLTDAAKLEKLYRSCVREAVNSYRLTSNEIVVLLFLGRHAPQQDTATDIASSRGISKALVARSVDCLHRRGFLECRRDKNDRRIVHLCLCGEGIEVAEHLKRTGIRIAQKLRENITDEELQAVHQIMCKMQRNLDALYDSEEGTVK